MDDRLSLVAGVLCGFFGLSILARLDVPVIERGGIPAGFASFELAAAVLVLSFAYGSAGWRR